PDALPARDAKAGADDSLTVDPRVTLMIEESWRHAKAIGAWGAGAKLLAQSGLSGAPGVVSGDSATEVFTTVRRLMAAHRVWERFPASVA
ncbi:catalase HPII, partial [Microbispora rosea]